jgi:hypothetical protein
MPVALDTMIETISLAGPANRVERLSTGSWLRSCPVQGYDMHIGALTHMDGLLVTFCHTSIYANFTITSLHAVSD